MSCPHGWDFSLTRGGCAPTVNPRTATAHWSCRFTPSRVRSPCSRSASPMRNPSMSIWCCSAGVATARCVCSVPTRTIVGCCLSVCIPPISPESPRNTRARSWPICTAVFTSRRCRNCVRYRLRSIGGRRSWPDWRAMRRSRVGLWSRPSHSVPTWPPIGRWPIGSSTPICITEMFLPAIVSRGW